MDMRFWTHLMRETIEMVVKALVDDAEAVEVREVEREGTTRIEIRVQGVTFKRDGNRKRAN